MARWIGAILIGLAGLTMVLGGRQGQLTRTERTLVELQQILVKAWVAGDRATIERIIAPEWTSIGPDGMRVGPLSGVLKEALLFSFTAAAQGTPIEGARLEIEDVPVTVWCVACDAEQTLASVSRRRCPVCDESTPDILRGADLELVGLEVVET